jgi:hypothetical protein
MATDTNFNSEKILIGGIRKDSPSAPSDGEPGVLRLDSNGNLVTAISGTVTVGSVSITSSDSAPIYITVGNSDFDFVAAGGQTVAFTDSAARSTALTVGTKYQIVSDQDCYVASGTVAVTATSSSFRLLKNQYREYVPTAGYTYVSALRIATSGNLYISQANRP